MKDAPSSFSTPWKIAECRARASRRRVNARSIAPRFCAASKRGFASAAATVFHTVEKSGHFFHTVENFFPLCGKTAKKFSIVWKTFPEGP